MAQCISSLIIIDEISIGLDRVTLSNVINEISRLGTSNQIWLVDHSDIVLNAADKKIYFGPGSGIDGGKIVEHSPHPKPIYRELNGRKPTNFYTFTKLRKRNINIATLSVPMNRWTTITGESGCGKSTLIDDCIVPYLKKHFKQVLCEVIGQDRNQSITSKSTVATFLDLKKHLDKYGDDVHSKELCELESNLKSNRYVYPKLSMLMKLGLGYLTFDRKIQTLSTGELLSDPKCTVLMIEHNDYLLRCSDFILDFGKRRQSEVTHIPLKNQEEWLKGVTHSIEASAVCPSHITFEECGITKISSDTDRAFDKYESQFKGGLLKNLSSTAQWISLTRIIFVNVVKGRVRLLILISIC